MFVKRYLMILVVGFMSMLSANVNALPYDIPGLSIIEGLVEPGGGRYHVSNLTDGGYLFGFGVAIPDSAVATTTRTGWGANVIDSSTWDGILRPNMVIDLGSFADVFGPTNYAAIYLHGLIFGLGLSDINQLLGPGQFDDAFSFTGLPGSSFTTFFYVPNDGAPFFANSRGVTVTIPEPGSLFLIALGLLGCAKLTRAPQGKRNESI